MSSLFGSLSIALRSLLAQQGALGTVTNNIANANTPGYSRQRPVLREEAPIFNGHLVLGDGVTLESIRSIRDRILELRLHQETQHQERLDAFLGAMRQVEALFNETEGIGLESVLSKFFDSLQALSVNPSSLPLRQGVLTAAENLAAAFRQTTGNLSTIRLGLDRAITQGVGEANRLAAEIANLNGQIAALETTGQDAGALVDRRNLAIRDLSGLVDVAIIDSTGGGLTITTTNGTPLVAGITSLPLDAQLDSATGMQHVFSQGTDITSALNGGKIAGLIEARDSAIPSVQADLDNLAANLASAVNTVHRNGFDLSGSAGGDLFVPFVPLAPGSNAGAAASFALALTDPAQVAASSDGTLGSNGTLMALLALRNQAVVAGQRPVEFYSNLVFRIGDRISDASAELEAENLVLKQLENQRSAISGVSLDEEATNLIRYQRAFEAAARVIAMVDELTSTTLNMLGRG